MTGSPAASSPEVAAGAANWIHQLRDRRGRWIKMGSTVTWSHRGSKRSGTVVKMEPSGRITASDQHGTLHLLSRDRITVQPDASATNVDVHQIEAAHPGLAQPLHDITTVINRDIPAGKRRRAIDEAGRIILGRVADRMPDQTVDAVRRAEARADEAERWYIDAAHNNRVFRRVNNLATLWADEWFSATAGVESRAPAGIGDVISAFGLPNPFVDPIGFLHVTAQILTAWLHQLQTLLSTAGPVTAAGDSWRWQLRDRLGRWIEMGAEVKWLAKGRWLHGTVTGSPSPGMAEVEEYQTLRKHVIAASRLEVVEEAERILDEVEVKRDAKGRIDWRATNLSRDVIAERIERARVAEVRIPEPEPDTSHRGSHQPPDDSVTLDNLADPTVGTFPDDVYDHPEWYMHTSNASERYERESLAVVRRVRGKPDAKVKVYRAVPDGAPDQINPGDWVTLSRAYAEQHAEDEDWKIITAEVTAREVRSGGNDLIEWGYWGEQPVGPDASRIPEPEPEPDTGLERDIAEIQSLLEPVDGTPPIRLHVGLPPIAPGTYAGTLSMSERKAKFQSDIEEQVRAIVAQRPDADVTFSSTTYGVVATITEKDHPTPHTMRFLLHDAWNDVQARDEQVLRVEVGRAGARTPYVSTSLTERVMTQVNALATERGVEQVTGIGNSGDATRWMVEHGYRPATNEEAVWAADMVYEEVLRPANFVRTTQAQRDEAQRQRDILDSYTTEQWAAVDRGEEGPRPPTVRVLLDDFGDFAAEALSNMTLVKQNPRKASNASLPTLESLGTETRRWKDAAEGHVEIRDTIIASVRDMIDRGVLPGVLDDYSFTSTAGPHNAEIQIHGPRVGSDPLRITVQRKIGSRVRGNIRVPKVTHTFFSVSPPTAQGLGIGSTINGHLEDLYRRRGIKEIHLTANIDVGGYAWARAGYDFDSPTRGEAFLAMAKRRVRDPHMIALSRALSIDVRTAIQDEIRVLQERLDAGGTPPTPLELAMIGYAHRAQTQTPLGGTARETWFGKQLMLGTTWAGVKRLEPPQQRETARRIPDVGSRVTPETVAAVERLWDVARTGPLPVGTIVATRNELLPPAERMVGAEDPAAWTDVATEVVVDDMDGYRWVATEDGVPGTPEQRRIVADALNEVAAQFPLVRNMRIVPAPADSDAFGIASGGLWYRSSTGESDGPTTGTLAINFAITEEFLREHRFIDGGDNTLFVGARSKNYAEAMRAMIIHEVGHLLDQAHASLSGKVSGAPGRVALRRQRTFKAAQDALDAWVAGRYNDPLIGPDGQDRSWYSTENQHEFIAEAFADGFLHGDGASPEGRAVYRLYRSMFRTEYPIPEEFFQP